MFGIVSTLFLCYFLALDAIYTALFATSFWESGRRMRRLGLESQETIIGSPFTPPISIIVPAFNEEAMIVDSVDALRLLEYSQFEIVVVDDGSTDGTLDRLVEAYGLVASTVPLRMQVPCRPIRGVYVSRRLPNLVAVSKENGGCKADASNAGINAARYPLVCITDADAVLDKDTLLRVVRPFIERPRETIAVGGTVRIVNGCTVNVGRVTRVGAPRNLLAALQTVEYMRAFIASRTAWSRIGGLFLVSGAFGVFRKDALVEVGGYDTDAIGEDMDLVLRMHRHFRGKSRPYRIVFVSDPVVWTEAPETLRGLRSQRKRWHRGLLQCLWRNRSVVFAALPRFGQHARAAVPVDLRGRRRGGGERRLRRRHRRSDHGSAERPLHGALRAARHGVRGRSLGDGPAHGRAAKRARHERPGRRLAAAVYARRELRLSPAGHALALRGHDRRSARPAGHLGPVAAKGLPDAAEASRSDC